MNPFTIKNRQNPYSLIAWIFFLALAAALLPFAQIHADTQGRMPGNNFSTPGYKEQIRFIDLEIEKLQSNMNFLQFKIEQMESEHRFVPPKMRESIKFKKFKLKALRSLRNRYENLIHKGKEPLSSDIPSKTMQQTNDISVERIYGNIMNQVKNAGLSDWLEPLSQSPCTCLATRLPILFSSGSAKIPKGYQSFLQKLASFLKNHDVRILVKGYADTDPIHTKQYPSNLELGASRAASIARALMGYGIKPSVFEVASTGEYRFISRKPVKWKNLQRHATIQILFPDCKNP